MKRVMTVTTGNLDPSIKVKIELRQDNGQLTRGELSEVMVHLADATMRAIASAPFVSQPLSQQKVR